MLCGQRRQPETLGVGLWSMLASSYTDHRIGGDHSSTGYKGPDELDPIGETTMSGEWRSRSGERCNGLEGVRVAKRVQGTITQ